MNSVSSINQLATQPLTTEEVKRLKKLERQIIRGSRLLVGIGRGLAEINRDKLFRGSHSTFEAYVEEKLGFTRGHAYNLIKAAEADANIRSIGGTAPTNEYQLRPLIKLTPEQQREAWQQADAETGGNVTHDAVKAVVDQITGKSAAIILPFPVDGIKSESQITTPMPIITMAEEQVVDLLLVTSLKGNDDATCAVELDHLLTEHRPLLKATAQVLVFSPHHDYRQLLTVAEAHGFHVGVPVVVDLNQSVGVDPASFMVAANFVLHFYKPGAALFDPIGNVVFSHGDDLSQAQKPVVLLADLIESAVGPKAVVLDPTDGAAATENACMRTSRTFCDLSTTQQAAQSK